MSFRLLKDAFMTALLLTHYDLNKLICLEIDVSDYVIGAIISQ